MTCDMCGSDAPVKKGLVEGVEMKLCSTCLGFANKIVSDSAPRRVKFRRPHKQIEDPEIFVVPDYARIIKAAREKTGKKQEDVAKELNIKESLLSHFETGKTKPSIKLAKQLERHFHIQLIAEIKESDTPAIKNQEASTLTLGDLIKKK